MAVDLPQGWMRQIIGLPRPQKAAQRPPRCRGSFWDAQRGCAVSIDLGNVRLTVPSVFRAASLEDEPKNILSWELGFSEEGAAQNSEIPFNLVGNSQSGFRCNTRTNSDGSELTC